MIPTQESDPIIPFCRERTVSWLKQLRNDGYPFPQSYFVLDVETSGLEPPIDLIMQFGHADVRERRMVHNAAYVLNWPSCGNLIQQDWLKDRLQRTKDGIERTGSTYRFSYNNLYYGKEPIRLIKEYHDFIKDWQDRDGWFVTHNGYHYDSHIIQMHFKRFLGSTFQFDLNRVLDTGLIEKSIACQVPLRTYDTIYTYHKRVYSFYAGNIPGGALWSLQKHCIPKYRLDTRNELDMSQAHTADFDCRATHLLFEEYRNFTGEI